MSTARHVAIHKEGFCHWVSVDGVVLPVDTVTTILDGMGAQVQLDITTDRVTYVDHAEEGCCDGCPQEQGPQETAEDGLRVSQPA